MINLRKLLYSFLSTNFNNVAICYHTAPKEVSYPYIVFDFPSSFTIGDLETVVVDIDIWDNKTDTTELEILVDNINNVLNKTTLSDTTMSVVFYLDTKMTVDDDDARIQRRKYVYQARLFKN